MTSTQEGAGKASGYTAGFEAARNLEEDLVEGEATEDIHRAQIAMHNRFAAILRPTQTEKP